MLLRNIFAWCWWLFYKFVHKKLLNLRVLWISFVAWERHYICFQFIWFFRQLWKFQTLKAWVSFLFLNNLKNVHFLSFLSKNFHSLFDNIDFFTILIKFDKKLVERLEFTCIENELIWDIKSLLWDFFFYEVLVV